MTWQIMTPKTNQKSEKKCLPNSMGVMTKMMSVWRHLLLRKDTVLKPIDLSCELMGQFVHAAVFNATGYFLTDLQALVCGSFSVSLSSSIVKDAEWFSNIGMPLGCSLFPY